MNARSVRQTAAVFLALLSLPLTSIAATQTSAAADSAFAAGNYAAAAAAYQRLIDLGVDLPHSWFELGASYQHLKRYDEAVNAYNNALKLRFAPVNVYYQLARIASLRGQTDSAVTNLHEMFAAGFMPTQAVSQEPDFAAVLSDSRVVSLLDAQMRAAKPCLYESEFRAMDFWIGDWSVVSAAGQPAGSSHVELIMDKCIIFENWTGIYGLLGKSFSHFDPSQKAWIQYYVNARSFGTMWTGRASGGSMIFLAAGPTGRMRMTITPLKDGRVRQLFESSSDGAAWTTSSDLFYTRTKPQ